MKKSDGQLEIDYLKNYEQWHLQASVSGMGQRKVLWIRIGAREFRVTSFDKVVYQGKSSKAAIVAYNKA